MMWIFQPHLPRRWTGTVLWVLSYCRSRGPKDPEPPTSAWVVSSLSSLWAPPEGLHTVPLDGLHKVVGDLPLVLKQVFDLGTVCITWKWGEKQHHSQCQRKADIKMRRERGCPVLTCMTSVHVCSVAVVLAPASHDIVHKVRLCHIHWGIYFHLPKDMAILSF